MARIRFNWMMQPFACAVAALSTTVSTAALDKHPQSQERGITLDLGFSNFTVGLQCFWLHGFDSYGQPY